MTTHGVSAPHACSVSFDTHRISAYGTAARALFFVALEQPGPWGREAATQSHLPAGVGSSLSAACSNRGGRLTLLRRPGRHADEPPAGAHAAYLAWAGADPWLLEVRLDDPARLLAADLDALARGDQEGVVASLPGAALAQPVLLVCTNGRRDVCCAVRGRPVALDAAALLPDRVWEASHTGGHRFAPTGVLLPHGATFARLDAALCAEILHAADDGEMPLAATGPQHDRGPSAREPGAQAAEAHVRHVIAEKSLTALTTSTAPPSEAPSQAPSEAPSETRYVVQHRDGRQWLVHCRATPGGQLPESCGKAAGPVVSWHIVGTDLLTDLVAG